MYGKFQPTSHSQDALFIYSTADDTVDGTNPKQPPGMVLKPGKNNGINYQPQLDIRISFINSIPVIQSDLFIPYLEVT